MVGWSNYCLKVDLPLLLILFKPHATQRAFLSSFMQVIVGVATARASLSGLRGEGPHESLNLAHIP